jgi:hypothetical protein
MSSYTDNSHVRFWVKAGLTGNILSSFNVTSLTDTGPGVLTVTIATDFASADWACGVCVENADATIDAVADLLLCMVANASQAAGTVQLLCAVPNGTAAADPVTWHVLGVGNQ